MLAAIHDAKKCIDFETYNYWQGRAGDQFTAALAKKARAGVRVRLIFDWQGSQNISTAEEHILSDAGIEIAHSQPLEWYDLHRTNNRTRRELLVIDGTTGIICGTGASDACLTTPAARPAGRDPHFRVEGAVLLQLQAEFSDKWSKLKGERVDGEDVTPPLPT